jgi:peroxiredoxin
MLAHRSRCLRVRDEERAMTPAARILPVLMLMAAATAPHAATSGEDLAEAAGRSLVGKPAPRLVVKTIDGDTIDLGRLYGRQAVYLKFWATWCVPCRQQMPHFQHAFETAGPDMEVIAVNTGFNDSLDTVRSYRRRLGITMPIVIDDGRLAAAFGLRVTPQHIVIGRDGRILYVGHLADPSLDAALTAARAEPAAAVPGVAGAAQSAALPPHYRIGDRIAALTPLTLDGGPFPFRDADSGPLVLVFLSPWCESYLATSRPAASQSCRRMREQVSELVGANGVGTNGVRWLGIASGLWATSDDLREYRKKYGMAIPLTLDESGALFRQFGVTEVPTALVIDRQGRITGKVAAGDTQTRTALRHAVDAL